MPLKMPWNKIVKEYEPPKFVDGPKEMQCLFCGQKYVTESILGQHDGCTRRLTHMPWAQYLQVLENLKRVIEEGEPENHWNSDYVGDKDSACSWGLCTKNPAVYPDPDMHIWPWQNETQGRHAPNYRGPGMHCPMCYNWERQAFGRPMWEASGTGCFYSCRLFSPEKGMARPTRKDAINLIQARINLANEWVRKNVVADETERNDR